MSLRTCSWLFPQKEQRYGTLGPLELLLVVTCPISSLLFGLLRRGLFTLRDRRAFAAGQARIVGLGDQRVTRQRGERVKNAIVLRRVGSHEIVPIGVMLHLVERLAGVASENLVVALDEELPFLHLDDRVRRRTAEAARALVDHDPAVRQGVALALRAGCE